MIFADGAFYVTIADADIKSLESLHTSCAHAILEDVLELKQLLNANNNNINLKTTIFQCFKKVW